MSGHGESETPEGAWMLEDVADDLALFIVENHLSPINFIGHSQGGMIGLRLTAKYPELVNKLILIGASARPEFPERIEYWKSIRKSILEDNKTNLHEVFKGIQQYTVHDAWLDENPEKVTKERDMMLSNSRKGMAFSIDSAVLNRTDAKDLLPLVKAETLVICGEHDKATPLSLSNEISTGITNSCIERLAGAGHHVPIEVPGKTTEIIENFLKN